MRTQSPTRKGPGFFQIQGFITKGFTTIVGLLYQGFVPVMVWRRICMTWSNHRANPLQAFRQRRTSPQDNTGRPLLSIVGSKVLWAIAFRQRFIFSNNTLRRELREWEASTNVQTQMEQ